MSRSKKIIILLSSLLILVLIYLGVLAIVNVLKDDDTKEESTIEVLQINKDDATAVTIESRDGNKYKYELSKDGTWNLTSKHDFRVKSYVGIMVVTQLGEGLKAKDIADTNPEDLSQYGLDNPTSVTTITMKDGSKRKITLGDISPSNDVYYVTVDGDENIYMITRGDAAIFVGTEKLMWDNFIFSFNDTDMRAFTLYEKGKKVYKLEASDDGKSWEAVYPLKTYVNYDNWQTIQSSLTTMVGSDLVDKKPKDLSVYGLDNPRYTMDIDSIYGNIKVDIGNDETKSKYVYAKIRGYDEVFILNSQYIAFAGLDVTDILSKGIYSTSIDEVSEVDITVGKEKLKFEIDYVQGRDESENKYVLNGKTITEKEDEGFEIQNFFVTTILVEMDGIEKGANVKAGNYDMTISFTDKESKDVTTFGYKKKNADSYYVFKNDKYMGITASAESLLKVVDGMSQYM